MAAANMRLMCTGAGLLALVLTACTSSSTPSPTGVGGSDEAAAGSSGTSTATSGGNAGATGGNANAESTAGNGGATDDSSGTAGEADPASTGGTASATGGGAGAEATGGTASATGGSAGAEATGGSAGAEATGGSAGAQEARSELPHDTTPDISETDYEAFVANTNDFGFDLFDALVGDDTNVVFSPVSTAVALSMTYAGARGTTATQMAAAMHNDLPDDTFHAGQNQLALDLESRNIAPHETTDGTKSVRLSLVNAAFAQQNYPILPAFLDTLSSQYDAGVTLLDFVNNSEASRVIINEWVAGETENRIEDLIPPNGVTRDSRLVLANALYFYATWQTPFLLEATSEGTFETLSGGEVTVPMMHETSHYAYAEGPGYQLVDLPYDGNELTMTLLLPEAGRFAEIRDSLSDEWLKEARASITTESEIQLSLPKFSFTWGTESLKPALEALGMTDAFVYPIADFTGIESTRELYISDVFHQAFIAVDEHGTEAAAATAVVLTAGAVPDPPIPFSVDRPFLFLIRDATGLTLFVGQVGDPTS